MVAVVLNNRKTLHQQIPSPTLAITIVLMPHRSPPPPFKPQHIDGQSHLVNLVSKSPMPKILDGIFASKPIHGKSILRNKTTRQLPPPVEFTPPPPPPPPQVTVPPRQSEDSRVFQDHDLPFRLSPSPSFPPPSLSSGELPTRIVRKRKLERGPPPQPPVKSKFTRGNKRRRAEVTTAIQHESEPSETSSSSSSDEDSTNQQQQRQQQQQKESNDKTTITTPEQSNKKPPTTSGPGGIIQSLKRIMMNKLLDNRAKNAALGKPNGRHDQKEEQDNRDISSASHHDEEEQQQDNRDVLPTTPQSMSRCDICNRSYKSARGLKLHEVRKHAERQQSPVEPMDVVSPPPPPPPPRENKNPRAPSITKTVRELSSVLSGRNFDPPKSSRRVSKPPGQWWVVGSPGIPGNDEGSKTTPRPRRQYNDANKRRKKKIQRQQQQQDEQDDDDDDDVVLKTPKSRHARVNDDEEPPPPLQQQTRSKLVKPTRWTTNHEEFSD